MNEAETRAEQINPALAAAGWGVVEGSRILREYRITAGRLEGFGRRGRADIADYVPVREHYESKQQAFLEFVLAQYVAAGVHELDQDKLAPLLRLKYNNAIGDAIAELGQPDEINQVFAGFQKYLYQSA